MSNIVRYNQTLRLLHWSMAFLLLSMIMAGLTLVQSLATWQFTLLNLHKSFGLIALLLASFRLYYKLKYQPDIPHEKLPHLQARVISWVHGLLYFCMFAMPITGLLSQYYVSRPISFFGLFFIPASTDANIVSYAIFRELHSLIMYGLVLLLMLHIAGVAYHYFVKKDDVLKRML
ncbi:cytochrome b [Thalassotalea sediminis]|uniref:cytochrome b n=1 Tax=Thalassotalea sediminis TaxID=1759089 RepID=UPI0025733268|nr:cytochrome b [Thalassotalea sediminis]